MLHKAMGKKAFNSIFQSLHSFKCLLENDDQSNMGNIFSQTGGSGQRRLTLVSPDEMGYTGAGLFKSWGGKGCLYVMPIQHRLDMSPLPYTAREFEAMPKARCVSCSKHVPLQLLSLHVETCTKPELDEV